jgi:DNA invertase Pin-like site-specific DNA recombinase
LYQLASSPPIGAVLFSPMPILIPSGGYLRVSSERQGRDDKVSISEQKSDIEKLAASEGATIVEWYCDRKKYVSPETRRTVQPSAWRIDRPDFVRIQADMRSGKLKRVYAWAQDRLARGSEATAKFVRTVEETEVQIRLVNGAWDTDTAELIGAVGGMEIRRIRQRMMMGRLGRIKSGLHTGTCPLGYRVIRGDLGENLGYEMIPSYRPWFMKIGKLFLAKYPYVEIRRRCPHPETGKLMNLATLRWLIKNPFYRGWLDYRRTPSRKDKRKVPPIVRGKHQPVWDEETCKAIEDEISRRDTLGKSHPRRRLNDHIFTGVLRCGLCGRNMAGGDTKRDGVRYLGYFCNTPKEHHYHVPSVRYVNHESNVISERKIRAQVAALFESLSLDEIEGMVEYFTPPVDAVQESNDVERFEIELASLEREYEVVKNSPTAARLLLAEIDKARRTLEDSRVGAAPESNPRDTAAIIKKLKRAKSLNWLGGSNISLRKNARELLPALYVAHGKLVPPPSACVSPKTAL